MSIFTIREADRNQAARRMTALAELYRAAYAEPPYCEGEQHVEAFIERFATEVASPGFGLVIAETRGRAVGFAHGITFDDDAWWSDADNEPREVRGVPKFAVMELVVGRPNRGQGIGTGLMTTLLHQRPEPYATLCANPAAPARQIYHRWGWKRVASAHPVAIGVMDVLLLKLPCPLPSPMR